MMGAQPFRAVLQNDGSFIIVDGMNKITWSSRGAI